MGLDHLKFYGKKTWANTKIQLTNQDKIVSVNISYKGLISRKCKVLTMVNLRKHKISPKKGREGKQTFLKERLRDSQQTPENMLIITYN